MTGTDSEGGFTPPQVKEGMNKSVRTVGKNLGPVPRPVENGNVTEVPTVADEILSNKGVKGRTYSRPSDGATIKVDKYGNETVLPRNTQQ